MTSATDLNESGVIHERVTVVLVQGNPETDAVWDPLLDVGGGCSPGISAKASGCRRLA